MRNFERHRHRHIERDDEPTGSELMHIDACGRRDDEADEGVRDPDVTNSHTAAAARRTVACSKTPASSARSGAG
jgi:hypothetical protein